MVGDEDHGPLLDRYGDPLRGRVRALLPLLPRVPLSRPLDKWAEWLVRTRFEGWPEEEVECSLAWLGEVRDTVLDRAAIHEGDTVLDVGTGTGLLALGALERVGEGGEVIALDVSPDCLDELRLEAGANGRLTYLIGSADVLPLPGELVDAALTRSVLIYVDDKAEAAREFFRVLRPGGSFSLFEPINRHNRRLTEMADFGELAGLVAGWEEQQYADPDDAMCNFDEHDLERVFTDAGFVRLSAEMGAAEHTLSGMRMLDMQGAPDRPTLRREWADELPEHVDRLVEMLAGQQLEVRYRHLFLAGVKPE